LINLIFATKFWDHRLLDSYALSIREKVGVMVECQVLLNFYDISTILFSNKIDANADGDAFVPPIIHPVHVTILLNLLNKMFRL